MCWCMEEKVGFEKRNHLSDLRGNDIFNPESSSDSSVSPPRSLLVNTKFIITLQEGKSARIGSDEAEKWHSHGPASIDA